MSLFNFNPSSFLGSGAFALDPSKFDFSNIKISTPKPVNDPIAIVSDNTPDTEVEILEDAGTVAVTEKAPDPIEEAIKSVVKPTPVPQPEVVIPEMFTPTTPVDLGMNFGLGTTIEPPTTFKGTSVGDFSQVSVPQETVEQDIEDIVDLFNTKSSVLSGLGLTPMGDAFAPSMFTQSDRAPVQIGTKSVNGAKVPETVTAIGATSEYIETINNLLSSDKADEFVKQMSEQTGEEYTKQDFVESLGLTWGDDAFTVSGKYGGFSLYEYDEDSDQYVKTLDKESSAIDAYLPVVADAIQDFFYKGALTAGLGQLIGSVETVENIKQASDVVKAVENDNVLGAVAGALDLAGLPSPTDYVEGFIEDSLAETADLGSVGNAVGNWAFNNADHLAEATVKFADTVIKSGDLGNATKDAVVEYIKDGGGISDLMPEGDFNFPDIDFEVPEVIEEVAQLIADGASEFNREIIKPVVKTVEEAVDPVVTVVRNTARDIKDDYKLIVEPIIEEGIEVTKNELADFDERILQPIKKSTEEVISFVDEKLGEFDDTILQPIKDDILAVANAVDQGLSDFNKEIIKPALQSIEDKLALVDADTTVLKNLIKDLFDLFQFGQEANMQMLKAATAKDFESVDLTTVELTDPELVEGFDLSNPFLRGSI